MIQKWYFWIFIIAVIRKYFKMSSHWIFALPLAAMAIFFNTMYALKSRLWNDKRNFAQKNHFQVYSLWHDILPFNFEYDWQENVPFFKFLFWSFMFECCELNSPLKYATLQIYSRWKCFVYVIWVVYTVHWIYMVCGVASTNTIKIT